MESKRIKNRLYNEFLAGRMIQILREPDIMKALSNVKGKYVQQARALIITLYLTGARPSEILELRSKDISKTGQELTLTVKGVKGGKDRLIVISSDKLGRMIWDYKTKVYSEMYLFFAFRGYYLRKTVNKKGEQKNYTETSYRLRYWFKQWFDFLDVEGIPPYYLRHNRFSALAEAGATVQDIKQLKGSKTLDSVEPYLHMSIHQARQISKLIKKSNKART
jgi:site-specific recombinase XerD